MVPFFNKVRTESTDKGGFLFNPHLAFLAIFSTKPSFTNSWITELS